MIAASEGHARLLVNNPADVAALVRPLLTTPYQEHFYVVLIDIRNKLIGAPILIALGSAHSVTVHPRDVFRAAVAGNAAGIVLAHNHPSGDPTPSQEDVELTRRLKSAGELLGIPVIDHVIVCVGDDAQDGAWRSLAEMGSMP